jgi:lipopolysaccharide export system permease protein
MVFAIIIFITYHFLNVFGRKLAEEDAISPFLGSWMSSFLLTPLAVFLTYRATNDIGVSIDLDWLINPFKLLFTKNKFDKKTFIKEIVSLDNINTTDNDFKLLETKDDAFLKNVVKNAEQFNYTESYRIKALKVLEQRNINQEELKRTNNLYNEDYMSLKYYLEQYKLNSVNALRFYVIAFVLSIAAVITKNLYVSLVSIISLIFLYISIYSSAKNLAEISKIQPKNSFINTAIAVLFGFPFYIIIYFYNKSKIKEVLTTFN